MKFITFTLSLICLAAAAFAQPKFTDQHKKEAQQLMDAAVQSDFAWNRLTFMLDEFGPRFSGSENLENAIEWIVNEMKTEGYDWVWAQPVKVPHWIRGEESAKMISPYEKELSMLGLGGSVASPEDGITAEVIVVSSFDDLKAKQDEVSGKIVLFNVPFTTYGETVAYRTTGAVEAARHGAVASLIRSVTPYSMQTPHTGTSRYEEGIPKIPHAAITVEDAELIQRLTDRGKNVEITMKMNAQTLPEADSHNVIAEIRGSHYPDEIIVLGGHIDSWDVGQGAMDDGGGSVAAWEALRLIKKLGLQPKRTIRVVLWTNEENGLRGANEYYRWVKEEEQSLENHILAMESDAGVFDPIGFGFSGSEKAFQILTEIGKLLEPVESGKVRKGGGGADIGPLMRDGVPGMGLIVDGTRYFWYHHTAADTIDKLDMDDFNECVATMAVFAYLVADLDERLPR